MNIRRRYRHLGRLRVIANTLAKHGFGYLLDYLGLSALVWTRRPAKKKAEKHLNRGQRFRKVLEELGPTAVKLGQILSTRADFLPKDIIIEMEKLQDQVPPFPLEEVIQLVELELGEPLKQIFGEFDAEPLGSASIGQVHRAQLLAGEEVVLKVQRPDLEKQISIDLEILRDLAYLAEKHTALGEIYSLVEMADELAEVLKDEMDYLLEARNGEQFRHNFRGQKEVYFPLIYWDYTTTKVLTMEYIAGEKISQIKAQGNADFSSEIIAKNLTQIATQMILFDGFFHGDLHPGNIAILPGNVVALMDFGMVGRLDWQGRKQLIDLILGLINHQTGKAAKVLLQLGAEAGEADVAKLKEEIERLRNSYYHLPFSQISLRKIVNEFMGLAYRYRIRLPANFTLLAKTLASLEGVVQELDPNLNPLQIAEPLGVKLIRVRYSPSNWGWDWLEKAKVETQSLLQIPGQVSQALENMLGNKFVLQLEHKQLMPTLERLDQIANRLALSLVLLSFSIIMAGLIIGSALGADPTSFFWRIPILQLGFGVALMMITWLIFSIFKTGRF